MNANLLPFLAIEVLLLASCQRAEQGLDQSVIEGTLVIPPATYTEAESRAVDNDSAGSAFGVGPEGATSLTYRAVVVAGTTSSFTPTGVGAEYGDPDWYAFSPVADGTFSLSFSLPGGVGGPTTGTTTTGTTDSGTGTTTTGTTDSGAGTTTTGTTDSGASTAVTPYVDAIVYRVRVYDTSAYDGAGSGLVAEGLTDGNAGSWTGSFDVVAGGDYLVEVGGVVNATTQDPVAYQLVYSGSTPSGDAVKVGAYLEADPALASNPVGGTTAALWQWDATTLTWTGFYAMQYVRSVVSAVDSGGDTAPNTTPPAIDEALTTLYLMGGTLQSLNKSPSAGSLYSTTAVEVATPGERVILTDVLVLDAVFPKVIGQTIAEALPDTTNGDINAADYSLILDTLVVQDVGMLSGLGYVDIVDGASDMSSGASGWDGNDSDVFAFTVPEPMYVSMVAGWADTTADIDFGIWGNYDPYGVIDYFSSFSSSYCLTGADPEVCTLIVPLEPDVQYYLVALGYLGSGDEPYHIELEWIAP